jgi:hypothetical protein
MRKDPNLITVVLLVFVFIITMCIIIKGPTVIKHYDTVSIKTNYEEDFKEFNNVDVINENTLTQTYNLRLNDNDEKILYNIKYSWVEEVN